MKMWRGIDLSDPRLKIRITIDKAFYYAGDLVQGVIHVNCLAHCPYRFLEFLLQGY